MDLLGIKEAVGAVVTEVPQLQSFLDQERDKLTATLTGALNNALAGFADGLSQALQLGYSIDGASISLEVEQIVIPPIKARLTVSMPLKPKETT